MKKVFREISQQEFKRFTKHCTSKNYMQSLPMFQRYQKIGREAYLFGLFEGDNIVVAGIASVVYQRYGYKVFTFSRGPLMNQENNTNDLVYFLDQCKKALKNKKGIVLQISPNILTSGAPKNFQTILKKAHFKYLGEYEQVKWIYTISFEEINNLPKVSVPKTKSPVLNSVLKPEDERILMKSFGENHRHSIRYATERYNLKLRELKPAEYDILWKLLDESGKLHGFVPRDKKFFEQIAEAFGSDITAIVAETSDGIPVAVAFFILYGDEVIYLSSGMNREHKNLCGPHLIQWAMIKYAYANGYKKYNFWGTNPDPENGVFRFKQGFHGKVEEFVGTFATSLSPLGAVYLKKLKKAEHRDL